MAEGVLLPADGLGHVAERRDQQSEVRVGGWADIDVEISAGHSARASHQRLHRAGDRSRGVVRDGDGCENDEHQQHVNRRGQIVDLHLDLAALNDEGKGQDVTLAMGEGDGTVDLDVLRSAGEALGAVDLSAAQNDGLVDLAGKPLGLDMGGEEIATAGGDELLAAVKVQVVAEDARQPTENLVIEHLLRTGRIVRVDVILDDALCRVQRRLPAIEILRLQTVGQIRGDEQHEDDQRKDDHGAEVDRGSRSEVYFARRANHGEDQRQRPNGHCDQNERDGPDGHAAAAAHLLSERRHLQRKGV